MAAVEEEERGVVNDFMEARVGCLNVDWANTAV